MIRRIWQGSISTLETGWPDSMRKSPTLAHIVNPFFCEKESWSWQVQQVTLAAMKKARQRGGGISIDLLTAQYPEDHAMIPSYFRKTTDLDVSALDLKSFRKKRKLPFIGDILERAFKFSNADFVVFTNIDIIPDPEFYRQIHRTIESGIEFFSINRRTIEKIPYSANVLEQVEAQSGKPHPGHDCFVFPRKFIPNFLTGRILVGVPWIGLILLANLDYFSGGVRVFSNWHLTRHLGDDTSWMSPEELDYRNHNAEEALPILDFFSSRKGQFATKTYFQKFRRLASEQLRQHLSINPDRDRKKAKMETPLLLFVGHQTPLLDRCISILESFQGVCQVSDNWLLDSGKLSILFPPQKLALVKLGLLNFFELWTVLKESFKCRVVFLEQSLPQAIGFAEKDSRTRRVESMEWWGGRLPLPQQNMSSFEGALSFFLEMELRLESFLKENRSKKDFVFVEEKQIEEIHGLNALADRLGLVSTPLTSKLLDEKAVSWSNNETPKNYGNLEERLREFFSFCFCKDVQLPKKALLWQQFQD